MSALLLILFCNENIVIAYFKRLGGPLHFIKFDRTNFDKIEFQIGPMTGINKCSCSFLICYVQL